MFEVRIVVEVREQQAPSNYYRERQPLAERALILSGSLLGSEPVMEALASSVRNSIAGVIAEAEQNAAKAATEPEAVGA